MRVKLLELHLALEREERDKKRQKERQKYSEIRALESSLSLEKEITKQLKFDQESQAKEIQALKTELAKNGQNLDDLKKKHDIQTEKLEALEVEVAQEKEKSEQQRAQQERKIQGLERQMELLMANLNVKDLALTQLDTQHGTLDGKCTGLRVDVDKLDMRSYRQENDINHVANCVEGQLKRLFQIRVSRNSSLSSYS